MNGMKNILLVYVYLLISANLLNAQSYTSYFTGSSLDTDTDPFGGVCLMGGATEDDNAMIWFLEQANGGDILVLRASGSDGYNDYFYSDLGVNVNSVESIVFNNASAAYEIYIQQKIQQAEAIWFAGGDQWDYVSYWRDTPIAMLINEAIEERNVVVGGTSAGMAILGGYYFSAQNGTVTSSEALVNPYSGNITIDSTAFLQVDYMSDVLTDMHYDDPDRKGRHVVFLSRILTDYGVPAKGIACDEYTAVCVDQSGVARVFGAYPSYDDNAFFIQSNCELSIITPENCSPNTPLEWNLGNKSLKVYAVKGTSDGSNTFDLNNWSAGSGGVWQHWYVSNGQLNQLEGAQPDCDIMSNATLEDSGLITVFPNPSDDSILIDIQQSSSSPIGLELINELGQVQKRMPLDGTNKISISVSDLSSGVYMVKIVCADDVVLLHKLLVRK